MKTIVLNKTFESEESYQHWIAEHLAEYTEGRPILMISSEGNVWSTETTLKSVTVI